MSDSRIYSNPSVCAYCGEEISLVVREGVSRAASKVVALDNIHPDRPGVTVVLASTTPPRISLHRACRVGMIQLINAAPSQAEYYNVKP